MLQFDKIFKFLVVEMQYKTGYVILPVAWIFEAMAPMGVSSLMDAVNTF
jgi:hypothetical protein